LAGLSIRFYKVTFPSSPQFDYHAQDSSFAAVSEAPDDTAGQNEHHPTVDEDTREEKAEILNINTATKQQLIDLPGIGEKTAERILDLRDSVGKFHAIDELKAVKGITQKKLDKIRAFITIQ